MIPETFLDMKRALYENDEEEIGWIVDFSVDSVVNMALRKRDLENFAALHEGNLYNNLFFQVKVEKQLESKSYLKSISRLTENIIKAVKMMENIVIFIIML